MGVNDMLEKLVELLEPYMSGEPCDDESGSCELANCRTCDAIALANRLIFHDIVPVVRCSECIHYETCEGGKDFCCFHAIGIVTDDFCSYGERKGGE